MQKRRPKGRRQCVKKVFLQFVCFYYVPVRYFQGSLV